MTEINVENNDTRSIKYEPYKSNDEASIITDGPINPQTFHGEENRLLFVGMEPYDKSKDCQGYNLSAELNKKKSLCEHKGSKRFFRSQVFIANCVDGKSSNEIRDNINSESTYNSYTRKSAVSNIKKELRKGSSNKVDNELCQHCSNNKNLLNEEIKTYNPTHIIWQGTEKYIKPQKTDKGYIIYNEFYKSENCIKSDTGNTIYVNENRIIISTCHPSYRRISPTKYEENIAKDLKTGKAIKENKYASNDCNKSNASNVKDDHKDCSIFTTSNIPIHDSNIEKKDIKDIDNNSSEKQSNFLISSCKWIKSNPIKTIVAVTTLITLGFIVYKYCKKLRKKRIHR